MVYGKIEQETVFIENHIYRNEWRLDGVLHREDGPAIEYSSGQKEWYRCGLLHRDDGPAIEFVNGRKEWYRNGRRHRLGGPAVECPDGHVQYWNNEAALCRMNSLMNSRLNEDAKIHSSVNWLQEGF